MLALLQVCGCLLVVASGLTLPLKLDSASHAVALANDATDGGDEEKIQQIQRSMAAEDLQAQEDGCRALVALANTQREGPGPYSGKRVSTQLLNAGIGEALAQGLLKSVEMETALGLTSPGHASLACLGGINGLTVQNDYDKGLALISHAPHLWQAILSAYRTFNSSLYVRTHLCTFAGLFGTPQPREAAELEVEAGAVDFVMKYLEDESIKSNPELFQRVYCALSDPVHERSGVFARAMANYKGPLQGIPILTRSLHWAHESGSTFHEKNGFGLLYEGVHVVGGVMEHDDANKTFAHAFVQEGLVDELVPIMREEPGDRLLQDMACEAIKWITDDNVAVQEQLVEMGALEIMAEALKRHSHPPKTDYGAVTIACSTALLNFASTSAAWQEQLRSLGVHDTLNWQVLAAFPPFVNTDFNMRRQWFPNSNILKLKMMLAASA